MKSWYARIIGLALVPIFSIQTQSAQLSDQASAPQSANLLKHNALYQYSLYYAGLMPAQRLEEPKRAIHKPTHRPVRLAPPVRRLVNAKATAASVAPTRCMGLRIAQRVANQFGGPLGMASDAYVESALGSMALGGVDSAALNLLFKSFIVHCEDGRELSPEEALEIVINAFIPVPTPPGLSIGGMIAKWLWKGIDTCYAPGYVGYMLRDDALVSASMRAKAWGKKYCSDVPGWHEHWLKDRP